MSVEVLTSRCIGAMVHAEVAASVEFKSAVVEEPKPKEKITATTSMKTRNEIPAKLQKLFPAGKGIVIGAGDGSYVQTLIKVRTTVALMNLVEDKSSVL